MTKRQDDDWLGMALILTCVLILCAGVYGAITGSRERAAERERCEREGGRYISTASYEGFCAAPGTLR